MNKQNNKAIAGLVLGIASLLAWLLPLLGYPVSIAGIVVGALGKKSEKKNMAIVGLVLSIIGLVLTFGNSAYGVYLALNELV